MLADHLFFIIPTAAATPGLALIILAFIVGTALGSFVQAAALRLNRDEDILFAPSACRSCNAPLSWRQNLPVLGWLMTWGHCRKCGDTFSPRYLIIELLTGGLAAVMAWLYAPLVALALMIAIALMLICALTDLEKMLLHLPVMLALGGTGMLAAIMPFWPVSIIGSILGMMAPVILLLLINLIYRVLRGADGFGSGDYWLMAAVGAWFGPVAAIAIFFISALVGAVVGIMMISLGKGSGQTALPFGVFISLVFIFWPILNILVIV